MFRTMMTCVFCLGVLLPCMAEQALAGPWIKAPGKTYLKLNTARFDAERSFNQGVDTGLAYSGLTTNVYAEVGLPGDMQLIADVPFVVATNQSNGGVNYRQQGFGDARLELNYGILPDIPLTLGLETKWPLYTPISQRDDDTIEAWRRSRNNFPDAGDGNIDLTPKLMSGYSFYPVPAWITGELGVRVRLGGFADGIFAAVSGGIFVWPEHVALTFFANTVLNIQEDEDPAQQATREFVYVQGAVLITAAPLLPDVSLSLGYGNIVFARNSAAGEDFSAGVSYEF